MNHFENELKPDYRQLWERIEFVLQYVNIHKSGDKWISEYYEAPFLRWEIVSMEVSLALVVNDTYEYLTSTQQQQERTSRLL